MAGPALRQWREGRGPGNVPGILALGRQHRPGLPAAAVHQPAQPAGRFAAGFVVVNMDHYTGPRGAKPLAEPGGVHPGVPHGGKHRAGEAGGEGQGIGHSLDNADRRFGQGDLGIAEAQQCSVL